MMSYTVKWRQKVLDELEKILVIRMVGHRRNIYEKNL